MLSVGLEIVLANAKWHSESSLSRHSKRCLANIPSLSRRKACEECSSSKTRCDLRRPHCGRCVSRDIKCSFTSQTSPEPGHSGLGERLKSADSTPKLSKEWSTIPDHSESAKGDGEGVTASFPTVDGNPGSILIMTYVLRVFRTYPHMFKRGQPPPFIHWSQMEGEINPTLHACLDILNRLEDHGPSPNAWVENHAANEVITLLAAVCHLLTSFIPDF